MISTEFLRASPLFRDLDETERAQVLIIGQVRSFAREEVIFREGDAGTDMFHLLQGSVGIGKHGHEIARIGPGRSFGEMTFLLGMDRSATATALEPCRCVVVNSLTFNRLQRDYPDTVRVMLVEMAGRLRDTSERAEAVGASKDR